jgi:flagellar protein FlbD
VIPLTRLNGNAFILNADLIRSVENLPDTYVTLTTGDRIVVRESMDEVVSRTIEYQRSKWLVPPPARRSA